MAVDRTYVRNIGPEFVNDTDARVDFAISIAVLLVNAPYWPVTSVDPAVGLLACHILKMGNMRGAIGLGGKRAGDLSQTFHASRIMHALANTGYGLMFIQLMDTLMIGPFVAQNPPFFVPALPSNFIWPD